MLTVSLAGGFNPLDATSVIAATGLIGIFCVLVAETGLLVGFFLPGDSLLFTAGLLAATHNSFHLPLGGVLAVAAAGMRRPRTVRTVCSSNSPAIPTGMVANMISHANRRRRWRSAGIGWR